MQDEAVEWAQCVLGCPVVATTPLRGGLTSTMLGLTDTSGRRSVLRLMTNEPWRAHGADLTRRERRAMEELASTRVPAPTSLGLDAEGTATGVAAHLMSHLPGQVMADIDTDAVNTMAEMLATIHDVEPTEPFRDYQSWAWEAKRVVPAWSRHHRSWQRAFDLLAEGEPDHLPVFIHRDYSHRNLLWADGAISGVVDWVEASTGPSWLDAGHAAANLALAFGSEPARAFLAAYAAVTSSRPDVYWLVMDAVGFLPPPGKQPMFGSATELARLDGWLHDLVARPLS